jgi:hypothetical protein
MTIKIRIETDNAAFEGDNIGCEIARILRRVAEIVDGEARKSLSEYSLSLLDVNGNAAGFAVFDKLEPDDEDEDETLQTCPACGGDAGTLGTLGNLEHMSCRDCGAEFSHEV